MLAASSATSKITASWPRLEEDAGAAKNQSCHAPAGPAHLGRPLTGSEQSRLGATQAGERRAERLAATPGCFGVGADSGPGRAGQAGRDCDPPSCITGALAIRLPGAGACCRTMARQKGGGNRPLHWRPQGRTIPVPCPCLVEGRRHHRDGRGHRGLRTPGWHRGKAEQSRLGHR